jgi:hypothetical protein
VNTFGFSWSNNFYIPLNGPLAYFLAFYFYLKNSRTASARGEAWMGGSLSLVDLAWWICISLKAELLWVNSYWRILTLFFNYWFSLLSASFYSLKATIFYSKSETCFLLGERDCCSSARWFFNLLISASRSLMTI